MDYGWLFVAVVGGIATLAFKFPDSWLALNRYGTPVLLYVILTSVSFGLGAWFAARNPEAAVDAYCFAGYVVGGGTALLAIHLALGALSIPHHIQRKKRDDPDEG